MRWLNRERLTVYPRLIIATYVVLGGVLILLPALRGRLLDATGKPIGADFVLYWSASQVARSGAPATVYDFAFLQGVERAVTGVEFPLAWYYPPTLLLMVLPLSWLPYVAAFLLWATVTLAGYLVVLRRIAPHPAALLLALAFPGAFQCFFHGQNGFLSVLLLGGGLTLVDRAPFRAGLLLGLMSYKPQLAVLIPVALCAGRHWKALAGAALSGVALVLASVAAFGLEPWRAFLDHLGMPVQMLGSHAEVWHKVSTVAGAALQLGAGLQLAMALQAIVALAALVAVVVIWRRPGASLALRASALVLGTLLVTHHLFPYDLVLLALPIAWLGWLGATRGWRRHEQPVLLLAWAMPMLAAPIALLTRLQLGPLVIAALMALVLRRTSERNARVHQELDVPLAALDG